MNNPLVELKRVSMDFGQKTVLHDVDFSIRQKEIVTIIGPNGAGKSTLVKLIVGLATPSRGAIARQPQLSIGYMPQKLRLDKSLPMKVNRFLSLANAGRSARSAVLAQMEISHLANQQMQFLSGGEFQRVLLARAILLKPDLLVLDEPLQGVDINGQQALYHLIGSLRDSLNCAILMVSHDLHLVMAQTDSVICLNHHVCCHGQPESVSQHPEYLRLFGRQAEDLAVYTHDHDHHHNIHGDIVDHQKHKVQGGCHHD